ncbi:hypothetical protein OROGR_024031 [Orobanche gracilis]
MRAGSACAAPQTLSAEAVSVLKHSLTLARRRGHAQVTPLHVAATLLSSRASSLRRACLKSQTPPHHQFSHHPLQCRALELCFNVALNRLPATPGPLLSSQPSLSNALVAALKRAQAHQRRGCIEQQHHQQQQPLIAIKVELEQLILSILDDPSVSRVMREAGFSSAAVKTNLEDSSINSVFQCYNTSGGIYSTPNSPPPETQHNNNHVGNTGAAFWQSRLLSCASEQNPFLFSPQKKPSTDFSSLDEDVKAVMEVLRNKTRKNTVIVGEFLSVAENVVAEIMGRVERGDVPEELKSAHFIKFQLSTAALRFMKREEVEMNIRDLRRKVEYFASSCGGGGGVIIYAGDLKWTVEIDPSDDEREDGYRPVDHLVAEMGKLLSWYNNNNNNNNIGSNTVRVWLMAAANFQTYVKCQMKQPPLDVHWALQAVSVSSGGLGLSLNATRSVQDSRFNFVKKPSQDSDRKAGMFVRDEEHEVLDCCPECKSNYEEEASFKSMHHKSFSLHSINSDTENGSSHLPFWLKPHPIETLVKDDLVQLRRKYNKLCRILHRGISHNAYDPNTVITNQSYLGRDYSYPSSYSCWPNKNSIFSDPETISFANDYPAVRSRTNQTASSLPRFRRQQSCHIDFSFSNGSSRCQPVELNLDALKGLDDKEVEITLALGNLMYNDDGGDDDDDNNNADLVKLFQENIPWQSEIIPSILEAVLDRSESNDRDKFILIKGNDAVGKRRFAVGMAKFVFGSSELLFCTNMGKNACGRESVERALRNHEKLVVLVEDAGYAGPDFVDFLGEGFGGESGHAVFIMTMDDDEQNGYNNPKENAESVIRMKLLIGCEPEKFDDLPDHKRKADWDLPKIKSKSHKNNENEHGSSNALDLNIKVDDETNANEPSTLRFLEKIKNCYVFNRDSDREARAKGMFLSKLKMSFEEVSGSRNSFSVEEKVLEEVLRGSGLYLNSLFEQWLKEVFETSLRRLDSGERERVRIRLCLEGKGEGCPEEDGFMGTCLPKSILVSFTG